MRTRVVVKKRGKEARLGVNRNRALKNSGKVGRNGHTAKHSGANTQKRELVDGARKPKRKRMDEDRNDYNSVENTLARKHLWGLEKEKCHHRDTMNLNPHERNFR